MFVIVGMLSHVVEIALGPVVIFHKKRHVLGFELFHGIARHFSCLFVGVHGHDASLLNQVHVRRIVPQQTVLDIGLKQQFEILKERLHLVLAIRRTKRIQTSGDQQRMNFSFGPIVLVRVATFQGVHKQHVRKDQSGGFTHHAVYDVRLSYQRMSQACVNKVRDEEMTKVVCHKSHFMNGIFFRGKGDARVETWQPIIV
jgi:hypothetical protein